MNAGVSPLLLDKNQIASGLNCSLRGGFIKPRPPYSKKTLNFNGNTALQNIVLTGLFQGGGYYRPDYGTESLIAQIAGHLVQFTESGAAWTVTDISVPGDLNDPNVSQVWMWQSEKWMIVQDGTGKLPIFYDGTISRRSYGPSILYGTASAYDLVAPPAIGSVVKVTLTSIYTGPFEVPVIFNHAFYQPIPQPTPAYPAILTNLFSTPGATVTSGSSLVVQPSVLGKVIFQSAVTLSGGFHQTDVGIEVGSNTISVGDQITIRGLVWNVIQIYNSFDNGVVKIRSTQRYLQIQQPFAPLTGAQNPNFADVVTLTNNTSPNVIIGVTKSDFVNPTPNETEVTSSAPGGQTTILISGPYNALAGQTVWIGSDEYSISPPPIPSPSSILYLINLTDTSVSNYAAGLTIVSVPELPAGRQGSYGMGCNAVSLTDGISYIIGDVVGSGAGTQANNYRDAVLKVTQNTFLLGGGSFRLPGTGDLISAILFPPTLDTSLGQGPLQIGTPFSFFTNVVPGTDPAAWVTLKFAIQTESLKDNGPLGQNSTIVVNSDTFFRSNLGIGSLVLARRDFNEWGNKPISDEVGKLLDPDEQSLLPYGSAASFDNRYQCTVAPGISAGGVYHGGMVSLIFDSISTMRQSQPPAWEGLWTGLNIFQVIVGRVNGTRRSFAFTFNYNLNQMELYESLKEKTASFDDNDETPILWAFETPILFGKDVKSPNELVQLRDGEGYFSDIRGSVHVKVMYRPDFYPCWTTWSEFDLCEASDANNSKPGYRMRVGFGEPSGDACEAGNNRPLRSGYFFQFRFEITGYCIFKGMRASAITQPQPVFAPVECEPSDCQVIDCDLPDDFRLYSLQGLPPKTALPTPAPPQEFSNQTVYFDFGCGAGSLFIYQGILPTWITYDSVNSQMVGAANIFPGVDQAHANSAAQTALNDFVSSAIAAGTLYCTGTDPAACVAGNGNRYEIQGYYNGMLVNPDGAAYPVNTWDGQFAFKQVAQDCRWGRDGSVSFILINGGAVTCIGLFFTGSVWLLQIYTWLGAGSTKLFEAEKTVGTTPAGIYTKTFERNPGNPTTLNIVWVAGGVTVGTVAAC